MSETPALSAHVAHVLETESPLHAWATHRLLGNQPRPPTDPMQRGTLLHHMLLEAGTRLARVEFDDYRKNDAKEARDSALASGRLPLLRSHWDETHECVERWRAQISDIIDLADGETEVPAAWMDDTVLCHGRFDWLRGDRMLVADLKCTEGSVHPTACAAAIARSAAVIQDWAYVRALELEDMDRAGRVSMLFLFAQSVPPYAVAPITCDEGLRQIGMGRWDRAKVAWERCLATNRWPGYGTTPIRVSAPAWMLAQELNRELVG